MASLSRRRVVVNLLRVFWVLVILWYEYGTFYSSVHDCNWPDLTLYPYGIGSTNQARTSHVLLVADPQIVDRYSYPNRNSFFAYLTRLIVDLNLRKNWQASINKNPDAIVFLGDMMDNGRDAMSDAEYERYYQRFKSIFRTENSIPQYFIPGNHDIGLGKAKYFSPDAHSRYASHFGPPNTEITIANHTLVLFDAPDYADEDAQQRGRRKTISPWTPRHGGSLEFVKKFANEEHTDPVILFSHIPLHRSDGKHCGPLREKGAIRPGVGLGYQNVLEKQSSQRLLEAFKPVIIFSGDDHDYCEYTHQVSLPQAPIRNVTEITVKTISMVMNVRRPGFQLLSLAPAAIRSETSPTYADRPCLLPDQLRIYLNIYLPLLSTSILIVLVASLKPRHGFHNKASSNNEVVFLADIEEGGDQDEAESTPYVSSRSQGLPSPASSSRQNKLTSRAPVISPGWFVSRGERRQSKAGTSSLSEWYEEIRGAIFSVTSGRTRSPVHRRGWLGTLLREIRDIAVVPLATFVVITWWTVTR